MTVEASDIDLTPGASVSAEETGLDEVAVHVLNLFGYDMSASVAVIIVGAGCFYIGVLIACIATAASGKARVRTLATSPMAFLLTSIIWFPLLNGQLVETNIAPIDAFVRMAVGDGEIHNQMFMLGIVMLLGATSWPIFRMAQGVLNAAINLVRKEAPST